MLLINSFRKKLSPIKMTLMHITLSKHLLNQILLKNMPLKCYQISISKILMITGLLHEMNSLKLLVLFVTSVKPFNKTIKQEPLTKIKKIIPQVLILVVTWVLVAEMSLTLKLVQLKILAEETLVVIWKTLILISILSLQKLPLI